MRQFNCVFVLQAKFEYNQFCINKPLTSKNVSLRRKSNSVARVSSDDEYDDEHDEDVGAVFQ